MMTFIEPVAMKLDALQLQRCATRVDAHLSIRLSLVLALVLISGATADAQTRRRGASKAKAESGSAVVDTATVAKNGAEEPADLAFRTVNGGYGAIAGRERSVAAPPHLSASDLRVLETRRRGNEPLVPLRGYPSAERPSVPNRPGYADASVGVNATVGLQAGYSGNIWPFDYTATLGIDLSNGHAEDNAHRSISAALGAGYIIGEEYGIFSGGHMGADVRYDDQSYHLYSQPSSPERRSNSWGIAASGANTTAGLTYEAGARYRAHSIADDTAMSSETSLEGTLSLGTSWLGLTVGANTDLRLTYLDGNSISHGRLQGFASYSNRFLTARAGLQFAAGSNGDGSISGTIAPVGELRLFPMQGLTLIGTITGGLVPTTLASLSAVNPYVALHPDIRQQREGIGYQIHARVEPSRAFALRATAARSHYNDYAYFDESRAGLFAPRYDRAVVNRITGDLSWQFDGANGVLALVEFTDGTIDDQRPLPYTPRWVAELNYTRRLLSMPIAIEAGARYIGTRSATSELARTPVFLMNLGARYAVTQRVDLTLSLRNLLDRRYELWDGYVERGIFAALGASARF